jgi:hypothetical protein
VSEPVSVLDFVRLALKRAGSYDRNDRAPPAALLWADKGETWRAVIDRLRERLPVFRLGDYDPANGVGPAYWLRCIVDRTVDGAPADGEIPILYLPGFDRSELRAVEACPAALQPIAELQYRGALFGSRAARDWTVTAFFRNAEEGLGVNIAHDDATAAAFERALPLLLDESVERLRRQAPLRAADLDRRLQSDPVRALLLWLNDPTGAMAAMGRAEWAAFVQRCKDDYGFEPEADGPIVAAERLGSREAEWKAIWERYAEVPSAYPRIADRLRAARPLTLVVDHPDSWPQDSEERESNLRAGLAVLRDRSADEVRPEVARLESEHGERRTWLWDAPLASALAHLFTLADATEAALAGESADVIALSYAEAGWRADLALLQAIAAVDSADDRRAVEGVANALYRPWADEAARRLQHAVVAKQAAGFGKAMPAPAPDECVLFTDGLRFDLGQRLAEILRARGAEAVVGAHLCALPSLTPTAKPAIAPSAAELTGGEGFGTIVASSGQTVTADVLRRTIAATGVQILLGDDVGDPSGSGWSEFGNIDEIGHSHGERFPHAVETQLRDLADRAWALLNAGWKSVRVVTDHGWLYVPGGLEKAELKEHLTVTRKGRAARLTDGATGVNHPVVPWRWNKDVRIALAPGISCYVAGRVYEHGGVSPQECVTPVVTISRPAEVQHVGVADVSWAGMRLRALIEGAPPGALLDLRTKAASATASKLDRPSSISEDGSSSALVSDPDAAGEAAFLVVLDKAGVILAQRQTTIGGE